MTTQRRPGLAKIYLRAFLLVLVGILLASSVSAVRLYSNGAATGGGAAMSANAVGDGVAFKFALANAATIETISFRTAESSAGTFTIQYQIWDALGSGGRPGSIVCKGQNLSQADIPASVAWVNGTINAGCSLSAATDYFAVYNMIAYSSGIAQPYTDAVGTDTNYSEANPAPFAALTATTPKFRLFGTLGSAGAPVINVSGPADNYHTANTTVVFSAQIDEPDNGDAVNATIWLNISDAWYAVQTTQVANSSAFHDFNLTDLNETSYQWLIEATEVSGSSTNSTARTIVIDRTNPILNFNGGNITSNGTVRNLHLTGETTNIGLEVTDTYVYGLNVTVIGDTSGKIYSNQTTGITGSSFNFSTSLNLSSYPAQTFRIETNYSDDHTAAWIPDYGYETTSNTLTFTTDSGVVCTLEASEANLAGLTVEKQLDRYSWTFIKNNAKTEHALDVTCSERLNYRGTLYEFPSFVIGDGWAKHWIDFNLGPGVTYNAVQKTPYRWTITATLPEASDQVTYSSIGGLNIVNEEFANFQWNKTPVTPSIQSDTTGVTWIYTNWTASTGANLYGIYRDGVNVANTTATTYNHTGLAGGTAYTVGVSGIYNDSETAFYENTTISSLNRQTVFNGTLSVEVRNEITNDKLIGPLVYINLISDSVNITGNTTTGSVGLTNITSNNYTIRHSAIGWGSRDQYLEIGENDSGSIIVYLINDTNRDPGVVYVRDTQSEGVNGSIVKLLRYFGDENLYRVVQMATTNDDGRSAFDAEAFDAYYKWVVEYEGSTEVLTTIPEFLIRDSTTGLWTKAFTINIGTDFWESYTAQTGMTHLITFNDSTTTFTYTYNDPSGIVTRACLKVDYANQTRWETLGPSCLNAATGSINIVLPNENRTYHATAYYETSTKYSEETPEKLSVTLGSLFSYGKEGAFIGLVLFLGVIPLFAFSATVGVIATIIITAFLSVFSAFALFPFGFTFIGALTTVGLGFVVYAMRRS